MVAAITTATGGASSGREQTDRGFAAYFRWVAENRDAFVLLYGGALRQNQEFAAAVRRYRRAATAIGPLIDAGIDHEHQLTLARAIVRLSEGASRRLVDAAAPSIPTRSPGRERLRLGGPAGIHQPVTAS